MSINVDTVMTNVNEPKKITTRSNIIIDDETPIKKKVTEDEYYQGFLEVFNKLPPNWQDKLVDIQLENMKIEKEIKDYEESLLMVSDKRQRIVIELKIKQLKKKLKYPL